MSVSFRWMEMFRKRRVERRRTELLPNNSGQTQELRAELQASPLGAVGIDLEADLVPLDHEVDDATRRDEALHLAHREHARSVKVLHDLGQAALLRRADEQHVARFDALDRLDTADDQAPGLHGLAVDGLECLFGGIVAQDADGDGAASLGQGLARPFDELDEVIQEGGLDLVLVRGLRARAQWRAPRHPRRRGSHPPPPHEPAGGHHPKGPLAAAGTSPTVWGWGPVHDW